MKSLIRKILKEETTNRFIEKVANYIKLPYFENMEGLGLTEDEYELVLSKLYNQAVTIEGNGVYDSNGNIIYYETSNGRWQKWDYDENGRVIYYGESNGFWEKFEYDQNGNRIYYEDWDGYWEKYEHDSKGNQIYIENSNGFWIKREYDSNGKVIYVEDSDGVIVDNR